MTFTKILCATDFSPSSHHALQVAARLAVEHNAELIVAHAWYIPPIAFSSEASFPASVVQDVIVEAQRRLDEAVNEAKASGATRVTAVLLNGPPWVEVVGVLQNQHVDLCVVATRGRTGLARILLGSVAEKIVRHAPCSVLAVHPNTAPQGFKHVLVPTDFSPSADMALDLAASLVAPDGKITVSHVVELPVQYAGVAPLVAFDNDFLQLANNSLERVAANLRTKTKARIATESTTGYAGAETLSAIEADKTLDLVAMGSHGRTGIKRALLGSVAEKVVRHAHCPVLIARHRS